MKLRIPLLSGVLFFSVGLSGAQEHVQIHGLLQLRAIGIIDTNIYEGYTHSTFYMRRGEISLSSTMLEDRFHWAVRLDPIALASRIVQDVYAEYRFDEAAKVRFGQFKYPQSLDGQWSSSKLSFVRRSLVGRIYGDKRDIGIQLTGSSPPIEYAVGVFNGNGRNVVDNNSEKDVAGRITLQATDWLRVGGSFYNGTFLYAANTPNSHNGDLDRFGGDARASWSGLTLQGEYMLGKDDAVKNRGWYVQAATVVVNQLTFAFRIDQFTQSTDLPDQRTTVFTVGGYYTLNDALRIDLNYLIVDDKRIQVNDNQILAQWQVSF